jgi:RNA polymerase-binding transcription factor DksA
VLEALRTRLVDDRAERLSEVSEPLEPHSMDIADSATDSFDHDLALAFLSDDEHAIREIDAALQRISDGTYGICEETGQSIPATRLRAIPWTRWTKQAAEKLEGEGLIRGLKLGLLRSVKRRGESSPPRFQKGNSIPENLPGGEEPEIESAIPYPHF